MDYAALVFIFDFCNFFAIVSASLSAFQESRRQRIPGTG